MKPTTKQKALRKLPQSYCVKLNDGTGYIVWPCKIQPRGSEQAAIGLGSTATKAWQSVVLTTPTLEQD